VGITRYSDDRVYGEKFPSDFDGHVGLTEVNTVGLNGQSNVYPVIDDQRDFVLFTELLCDTSDLEELNTSPYQCYEKGFRVLDLLLRFLRSFLVLGPR
jgi:hypothetical protein